MEAMTRQIGNVRIAVRSIESWKPDRDSAYFAECSEVNGHRHRRIRLDSPGGATAALDAAAADPWIIEHR